MYYKCTSARSPPSNKQVNQEKLYRYRCMRYLCTQKYQTALRLFRMRPTKEPHGRPKTEQQAKWNKNRLVAHYTALILLYTFAVLVCCLRMISNINWFVRCAKADWTSNILGENQNKLFTLHNKLALLYSAYNSFGVCVLCSLMWCACATLEPWIALFSLFLAALCGCRTGERVYCVVYHLTLRSTRFVLWHMQRLCYCEWCYWIICWGRYVGLDAIEWACVRGICWDCGILMNSNELPMEEVQCGWNYRPILQF